MIELVSLEMPGGSIYLYCKTVSNGRSKLRLKKHVFLNTPDPLLKGALIPCDSREVQQGLTKFFFQYASYFENCFTNI